MNNKFYNIPKDWYKEFNTTFLGSSDISNMNIMDNMSKMNGTGNISDMGSNTASTHLVSVKEGFLRGNLFGDKYSPYKNYKSRELSPKNSREELLYNILRYNFALTDLDLYLDIYPLDRECILIYNRYLAEEKKLVDEYEKKYGPLTIKSMNMSDTSWDWIKSPWPWEVMK